MNVIQTWFCDVSYQYFYKNTFFSEVSVLSDIRPFRNLTFYNVLARQGSSFCKGPFALREILFVLQKNLSTRNHFQCERFFSSMKILSSVTKLQRDRRVALEAYNFLSSEKIYCSVTATLQRVIRFRNRYHTKWYCVRDPIYRHLEMDRRGEMLACEQAPSRR